MLDEIGKESWEGLKLRGDVKMIDDFMFHVVMFSILLDFS